MSKRDELASSRIGGPEVKNPDGIEAKGSGAAGAKGLKAAEAKQAQKELKSSKAIPKSFVFLLLGIAIVSEVTGATCLKASEGFTVMPFSLITAVCYLLSLSLLVVILKHLPLGLTYGIWGGIGSAATMVVGVAIWGDSFTPTTLVGLVLIVVGTYLLNKGTDEIEAKRKPDIGAA